MQATLPMQSWLDYLRYLIPVTGVVHVGAGTGQDAVRYAHWNVPFTVLIEAEESYHDKLSAVASGIPGCTVHTALLSDREEEMDFYLATNPNENGVLPPEILAGLWRNLKTKEHRQLNASTLDRLLAALSLETETINWVVIDCLPALPIMRGAIQHLDSWDVIIARVVLNDTQLQAAGTTKAEVDAFLSKHGYRCIAYEEERQPAIGRALYARDWKASLHARLITLEREAVKQAEANAQIQKAKDEQKLLALESQQQVKQLSKAKEEQAAQLTEAHVRISQLTVVAESSKRETSEIRSELEKFTSVYNAAVEAQHTESGEWRTRFEEAMLSRDEYSRLASNSEARLAQVIKERDEHAHWHAENAAWAKSLKSENESLKSECNALKSEVEVLCRARDQLNQATSQLQARIEEQATRQQLLDDEVIRAHAQLDLVKDILINEKNF
jgi:hypothetical protein